MQRPAIIVFGAAVLVDGRPSPSLKRRIGYAARAADAWPQAPVLCSGGVGRAGPSEASIIATELTGHGVEPSRLTLGAAAAGVLARGRAMVDATGIEPVTPSV